MGGDRRRRMRLLGGAFVAGALMLAGAGEPARADTVFLGNGDVVFGQLEAGDLPLATSEGVTTVATRDLAEVRLGTLSGDLVRYRTGRTMVGIVAQPSYTIQLPSGQTVVFARERIQLIRLSPR